jgi:hypothetical protein
VSWSNEAPTTKLANPKLDDIPESWRRLHRTEITREYETRLVEATCLDASVRCARVALRSGR